MCGQAGGVWTCVRVALCLFEHCVNVKITPFFVYDLNDAKVTPLTTSTYQVILCCMQLHAFCIFLPRYEIQHTESTRGKSSQVKSSQVKSIMLVSSDSHVGKSTHVKRSLNRVTRYSLTRPGGVFALSDVCREASPSACAGSGTK